MRLIVAAVVSLVSLVATAPPTRGTAAVEPAPSPTWLIRGVRVFDGERMTTPQDVLVRDGVIADVGKELAAPAGAETLAPGPSSCLIPGLIDCHTHVIEGSMLEQALVLGVTTELDMFMSHRLAAGLREQTQGNLVRMADFRTAGTLVTAPRGHGSQFGVPIPTIRGPEEAERFVDARIAEGSQYVKVVYDDGRSIGLTFGKISRETLHAVVRAAHARGKRAVVHVQDYASATDALAAGADGLAHVFIDAAPTPEFLATAKRQGLFVIPTLAVIEGLANEGSGGGPAIAKDERLAPFLDPSQIASLNARFPNVPNRPKLSPTTAAAAVRLLNDAGVPILAGSDAPNPGTAHGASLHHELESLVAAGLTPAQALAAATSAPAAKFGLSDRGRIAKGLRADLVLLDADPTADIRATRAIAAVWQAGRRVDRDARRKAVAARKADAEKATGAGASLVSAFEEGPGAKPAAAFGGGWQFSTDEIALGKSTGQMEVVAGGAGGSKASLQVKGVIDGRVPYAWAGAMFYPGPAPFQPIDLSAKRALAVRARGDGRPARVMVFAQSLGRMPATLEFVPGDKWKDFTFPLADFKGADAKGLMGVLFAGGPTPGEFSFQIDDVRFE